MVGLFFSIAAGAAMSIQGVFNTRLQEKTGAFETTAFVQGTGFVFALIAMLFFGNGSIKQIGEVNRLYLFGGLLGIIITFGVIQGISALGTTFAVSLILVSQLTAAALIDAFGLFGSKKTEFGLLQLLGIVMMIGGMLVFKIRHE